MNATVSVIIPVYNMEDYLDKCLCSVTEQTYKNIEILVIDDGSTDASPGMCDTWARRDSRIRVLHKKNGGLSDARNAGLDICTGEYLVFIDSDDYVSPEYIEYLVHLMVDNCADISVCEHFYVTNEGVQLRSVIDDGEVAILNQEETLREMCSEKRFSHSAWAKMYRADFFSNVRFPVGHNFEDIATTYKLVLQSDRIAVGNRAMYYYLRREGSIMLEPFKWSRVDSVRFMEQMASAIVEKWPGLKAIATRRLFLEYFSCWKSAVQSDIHSREMDTLLNELYQKVKLIRGSIFSNPMSKKVWVYYLCTYLGKWFIGKYLRLEDGIMRRLRYKFR